MNTRTLCCGVAAVVGVLASGAVGAQVRWSVETTAGYDDNVGKAASFERDSTTGTLGGSLSIDDRTGPLTARAGGRARYVKYLEGEFPNDLVGSFDAGVRYEFVPERIAWRLDETFGQALGDVLAPPSPENRIDVNVISTGPEFTFPVGNRTFARFTGQYGRATYSDTRPDDTQILGSASLVRRMRQNATGSLNYRRTRVEYQEQGAPVYTYDQAFASFALTSRRQTLSLDAGATRVQGFGSSSNDPLARITWNGKVTALSSVSVSVGREVKDTSSQFRDEIRYNGIPAQDAPTGTPTKDTQTLPVTAQPLRDDYVRASFQMNGTRTYVSFGGGVVREEYRVSAQPNNRRTEFSASFARRMTPRVDLQASARWEKRAFSDVGASDRSLFADASLAWRIAERIQITATYGREKRTAELTAFGYTQNRYSIGVRYAPSRAPIGGASAPVR